MNRMHDQGGRAANEGSMGADKDRFHINAMKGWIMDATRKANSGHPGGAMSSSEFAYVLYKEFLNFDPDDSEWFNRDRFVLSAGHESMLLYSLLHLIDYIGMDDIKEFRQLNSLTPGHPERHRTPGVAASTGPLGQGFGMAVGLAVAETFLRNKLGPDVVDHFTYVLASDGDIQEPISLGCASLAGLWGLGKLIVYYDSNKIQIAGPTSRSDCTDYKQAFEAFCWQVLEVDGNDLDQVRKAIQTARLDLARPTLIIGHTTIAKGAASLEGSNKTHGAPFPEEEIKATKKLLGLPEDEKFYEPEGMKEDFQSRFPKLRENVRAWMANLDTKISGADQEFRDIWETIWTPRKFLPLEHPVFEKGKAVSTRKAWGAFLNANMDRIPHLMGGSADLDESNQTHVFRDHVGLFDKDNPSGRALSFGVREFPMAVILNGMCIHGGVIPFGATFLAFSDYCRSAIRMSALQALPMIYVFTHDSFYVGEDGPTHQPIEHIGSLRLIPQLVDLRPADANESSACIDFAFRGGAQPSCLFLTRQNLPVLDESDYPEVKKGPLRGGYVLKDFGDEPDLLLIASGSEVHLALEAAELLKHEFTPRVVSMPSMFLFARQPDEYKRRVLPPEITRRAAAEAGRPEPWCRFVGMDGVILGIDHYGHSAPAGELAELYGFTGENFARMIREKYGK